MRLLLLMACTFGLVTSAFGQTYPQKPIRIIVPLGAGGPTDAVTRIVADGLAARLGSPVVVENRPGAEGTLGMAAMLRAPPDGYTLGILNNSSGVTGPALMQKMPYDPVADVTPIACMARFGMFVIGNPDSPVSSIAQLIAAAHAKAGSLNWASSSGDVRVAGEYFNDKAAIKAAWIPFDGEPAVVNAVLSGIAEYAFVHGSTILGYRGSDRLRIFAVVDRHRDPFFPEVPTLEEAGGPAFTMPSVSALAGPKGLPASIVALLNAAIGNVISDAGVQQRLAKTAAAPWECSPDQLRQWVVDTTAFVDPLISRYHIGKQ